MQEKRLYDDIYIKLNVNNQKEDAVTNNRNMYSTSWSRSVTENPIAKATGSSLRTERSQK